MLYTCVYCYAWYKLLIIDLSLYHIRAQKHNNWQFKQNMEKTKEMLKDKDKMKEMEDSMKKRVEEGQKELEEFKKKKNAELEEEEKKAAADLKVSMFLSLIWVLICMSFIVPQYLLIRVEWFASIIAQE